MNKLKLYIKYLLISFISGTTGIVPGMSGGTMFAIFGVSEDLVQAITKVLTFKRKNIQKYIMVPLILGGGTLFSTIIYSSLFQAYSENLLYFFEFLFISLIIFSMPLLLKETKGQSKNKTTMYFLGGLLFGIILIVVSKIVATDQTQDVYSPVYLFKYAIISVINGMTMIIPGVSGTNVLLIFGQFENYINFTANFFDYLLQNSIFLICVIIGNIFSAFSLKYVFNHFKTPFFAIISGLTLSSIVDLYSSPFVNKESFFQAIVGFILGMILMMYVSKISNQVSIN